MCVSILYSSAWQPNFDRQISSHDRGGGVRGVEQWIWMATECKQQYILPDTGALDHALSAQVRVTSVPGNTTPIYTLTEQMALPCIITCIQYVTRLAMHGIVQCTQLCIGMQQIN